MGFSPCGFSASDQKLLCDHGFDGRVILEVPPTEFPKAGGIQSLIDSAQALNDVRESLAHHR